MSLSRRALFGGAAMLALAACGSSSAKSESAQSSSAPEATAATTATTAAVAADSTAPKSTRSLKISAIPDQDPEKIAKRDGAMAAYLTEKLGVPVEVVPVPDYAASVSLFKTGDLDLVFYGGLTGVQARLQVPKSTLIAQRDIDDKFESVFIANKSAGIAPFADVSGLAAFKGKRFTFGSESSTSGRLMPEYFLDKAGLRSDTAFAGAAGYSGSHDKTIDLVQAGSFDGGALNKSVWTKRVAAGTVDVTKVDVVFTSPTYRDYHWIAGPATDERFGAGFTEKLKAAVLGIDYANPTGAALLDSYGSKKFIETKPEFYAEIESIGRTLQLINE